MRYDQMLVQMLGQPGCPTTTTQTSDQAIKPARDRRDDFGASARAQGTKCCKLQRGRTDLTLIINIVNSDIAILRCPPSIQPGSQVHPARMLCQSQGAVSLLGVVEIYFTYIFHIILFHVSIATSPPISRTLTVQTMRRPLDCTPFAILIYALACRTVSAKTGSPPINLNIRRAEAPPQPPANDVSPLVGGAKKALDQWGGVALDMAGDVSCRLAAPVGDVPTDCRRPLFQIGASDLERGGTIMPSVSVGARYDFSKVWFGATKLFGSVSWYGRRLRDTSKTQQFGRIRDNLERCSMTLRAERDVFDSSDVSGQLCLKKGLDSNGDPYGKNSTLLKRPSLTLRLDNRFMGKAPAATVALRTRINRRINLVTKSTVLLDDFDEDTAHSQEEKVTRTNLVPRLPRIISKTEWENGVWLPDIRLSPNGWLAVKSDVGLHSFSHQTVEQLPPLHARRSWLSLGTGIKTGVRLTVSKKVPWSLWGTTDDQGEEQNTWVRLEVCGVNESGDTHCSATVVGAVEKMSDTLSMTLLHEQILKPPNGALTHLGK